MGGSFLLFLPILWTGYLRVAPVRGASMEPTLHDGQRVWYELLGPTELSQLPRGSLVVFRAPTAPGHLYVKRLVGLPGDCLRFAKGRLWVDGRALDLPRGAVDPGMLLSTRVPAGCFYVIGDHAAVSYDSRYFGAVQEERLVGRILFR